MTWRVDTGMPKVKSMVLFCCYSFVSSSTFPPSSISCGDLSFPAGPMLISYWSSGLRVGVCEMGKGEHGEVECWGIWVRAKNNFHLQFSQLLCADLKNVSMLVDVFSLVVLQSHTPLNSWERPQYNYSLISVKGMLLYGSKRGISLNSTSTIV